MIISFTFKCQPSETINVTTKNSNFSCEIKLPLDITNAGTPEAAIAEHKAYLFWFTFIFLCHLRQVFVGANIRPPRHMFPNAPCPDLWVPPPRTRGIRATALPVPHDSALVWWPKRKDYQLFLTVDIRITGEKNIRFEDLHYTFKSNLDKTKLIRVTKHQH